MHVLDDEFPFRRGENLSGDPWSTEAFAERRHPIWREAFAESERMHVNPLVFLQIPLGKIKNILKIIYNPSESQLAYQKK